MSFISWKTEVEREEHIEYIDTHWSNVAPHSTGFYVNDYIDQSQEMVNQTYRENFPRLAKIKKWYDPTNLFRLNANFQPS